ncbi:MAG: MFS transporter, partial [Deltaproteobacteria bacterium]|nr:MFS transporter [Deltaproteobacteria bacterium]
GLGLLLLGSAGYTPNIPQGQETADMLRVLYALVPCICNAVSIVIICFYPITEEYHTQIREEIERKKNHSE